MPAAPDLKEACVRAAHEVIAEHGVEQLSLRDVARRLGVSHQAPYKHYASRDHLLAEVIRRCFVHFAESLDARQRHDDARAELHELGRRYLAYGTQHALEYRLMFATPWPEPAQHPELVRTALHAFDVLRSVLRRVHGSRARQRVDREALAIWASLHGVASVGVSPVMAHLALSPGVAARNGETVLAMMSVALDPAQRARQAATLRRRTAARGES